MYYTDILTVLSYDHRFIITDSTGVIIKIGQYIQTINISIIISYTLYRPGVEKCYFDVLVFVPITEYCLLRQCLCFPGKVILFENIFEYIAM